VTASEKPRERVAIVGSRDYPSREVVRAFVLQLADSALVVSGGARGVDSWAVEAAIQRGLETAVFEADWDQHGNRAGPIRNAEIVAYADRLVAFWDGRSRGTLNTVLLANDRRLPISIYDDRGTPVALDAAIWAADALGVSKALRKGLKNRKS
jgi:hypothetical protein